MTLQTKLVISLTALLLAVIAVLGVVASRAVESILVAQVDRTLLSIGSRSPLPEPGSFFPQPPVGRTDQVPIETQPNEPGFVPPDFDPTGDRPFLRSIAEVWVAADGALVLSRASGFADDPDPLPDISDIEPDAGLVFLDSVDGTLRYRANAVSLPDGSIVLYAAPLREVATATDSLVNALLLGGGGVLLLGAAATRWTVRRATRPVDEMVETAEAIAAGDLTRRVSDLNTTTELGRLSSALNEMLAHIEQAVGAERAGQERLRQFVADASHELRTPIAAISGYSELRQKGALDTVEAEENAWSRIDSESRRMGKLVEELLTLTRLGQGQPLQIQEFDLIRVVRDAALDHAAIDPTRPVEVTGPDRVVMWGDAERLHQVMSSLLSNVRVHTPEGTAVQIDVNTELGSAEVVVSDDGPGIPEEAVERIFDRFYRADPSRSRQSGGSGLGLAIVRAIVEAHGGTVAASSVAGGGAAVTFTIPLAQRRRGDPGVPGAGEQAG